MIDDKVLKLGLLLIKMVFCFKNCSELLREKKILVIKIFFLKIREWSIEINTTVYLNT